MKRGCTSPLALATQPLRAKRLPERIGIMTTSGFGTLNPLLRLNCSNSVADAVADLGKLDAIGHLFAGFQKFLYWHPEKKARFPMLPHPRRRLRVRKIGGLLHLPAELTISVLPPNANARPCDGESNILPSGRRRYAAPS